jgi:4-amino-4-deoxy-L-arabinose transferase-like glycosyltransferase
MVEKRRLFVFTDVGILLLPALAALLVHVITNGQYGFHRDELAVLDDAKQLDWGYVAYPPLTPFVARLALALFGPALVGLRLFSAAAQCAAMVLAGLMARELGGGRWAQAVTAIAVACAPLSLIQGALFQYVGFDYLWWVAIAYCTLRLLNSGDGRWWLAIGLFAGLGLLTRYTIAFLLAGLAIGVLVTSARKWMTSGWLWAGAVLALLIWLPNVLWQAQHGFISLQFLSAIHTRDVQLGRTQAYLPEQFFVNANPLTLPLWVCGLWFYLAAPGGRRYRLLGWLYLVPFLLFLIAQARSYYLGPAYPMLLAAGAGVAERWFASRRPARARLGRALSGVALALAGVVGGALFLPIAPVDSGLWNVTSHLQDNFVEEIGWPDLVQTVAGIYAGLPIGERPRTAILTGNYGEAGAVDLYGPAFQLPRAVSGVDSYWLRGYPQPPPQTVIVLGYSRDQAQTLFNTCDLAGRVVNRYGVKNEESTAHPDIFVCRDPRQAWPVLWPTLQHFG